MKISRGQLIAAAGVAVIIPLALVSAETKTQRRLSLRFDAITRVILQNGVQETGGSRSCSKGNQRIVLEGASIELQSGEDPLRPNAWLRATKTSNSLYSFVKVESVGANPFGVVGEQPLGGSGRSEGLKLMKSKAVELCGTGNPNLLSSQLGDAAHPSESLPLGSFGPQGHTNG
jgi:hypothetical protein